MSKKTESRPIKVRLIYGFLWLIARIPLFISQPVMSFSARVAILVKSRSYRFSAINIDICFPEKTTKEKKDLVKKSLIHTFQIAPEIAKAWLKPCIADWLGEVHGEEAIKKDLANGKGILITGSHIGNWEVALFYLGKTFDFTCMYRKPRYQEMDDIICKGRCKNTTVMVPGDAKGFKAFLTALKKCKVAALLSDQEPGKDTGVFAPFFGHPAKTMDLIQKVESKTNSSVYQIAAIKSHTGKYDIYLESINIDSELAEVEYATKLNQELESMIRKYPEQYQWSYRRFKLQPEGRSSLYK